MWFPVVHAPSPEQPIAYDLQKLIGMRRLNSSKALLQPLVGNRVNLRWQRKNVPDGGGAFNDDFLPDLSIGYPAIVWTFWKTGRQDNV